MVYDSRLTVSGSRPDKVCTTKPKCAPGTDLESGTHQSRATTGLERMCTTCTMCTTFFKFLLKNISKHMIISERTFALKRWYTWYTSVELLYTLTFSCGTPGTQVVHKWYTPPSKWYTAPKWCVFIPNNANREP